MKKIISFSIIFCCLLGGNAYGKTLNSIYLYDVNYNEIQNDLDYKEIQKVIKESDIDNFNFEKEVSNVVRGENIDYSKWLDNIKEIFLYKFKLKKDVMIKVLILIIMSAIFTNFTSVMGNAYVAQTGYLVVYMILTKVIISFFGTMYDIGQNAIVLVKRFVEVLLPTYTVASFLGTGFNTATAFSQITLIIIVVIEQVFIKIVLPLISIYLIIVIVNNINETNGLSRLSDFIKMIIKWANRGTLGIVTGIVTIQKLIAPSSDIAATKLVGGGLRYVPYLGNSIDTAKDTVISAGCLIKNAMGGVSIVAIILICLAPIISLVSYIVIYELITVVSEPIADKRIINVVKGISETGKLLLQSLFTTASLLIITIALLAS